MSKMQKLLLCAVIVSAVALIIVFADRYLSARNELSALKQDLAVSTAAWKETNERKLAVQKELKAAKNDLREAELTLSDDEERTAELTEEIAALEAEIEELKTQLSSH